MLKDAMRAAVVETSLGQMLVVATDKGLCAIEFGDDVHSLRQRLPAQFPRAEWNDSGEFKALVAEVVAYVDAQRERLLLPVDIQGTAFQQRVWEVLRKIPAGSTITYAKLANQIGHPKAVRAVARACAANPLAVVVPCHRVVRKDGAMGGYRWGIERKRALLERESTQPLATSTM